MISVVMIKSFLNDTFGAMAGKRNKMQHNRKKVLNSLQKECEWDFKGIFEQLCLWIGWVSFFGFLTWMFVQELLS